MYPIEYGAYEDTINLDKIPIKSKGGKHRGKIRKSLRYFELLNPWVGLSYRWDVVHLYNDILEIADKMIGGP